MATTIIKPETLVGKKIRRREDPRLITGTATYVDDVKMPGMYHACIVRSPHAAARIKSVNAKPAIERPGVVAVFTGADVKDLPSVPCVAQLPGLRQPYHHVLAQDRVYYVGHPVAVVVRHRKWLTAISPTGNPAAAPSFRSTTRCPLEAMEKVASSAMPSPATSFRRTG